MKVFIFNQHWTTLGGGEYYLFELARILGKSGYEPVFCGGELSRDLIKKAESRFSLTLSNFEFISGLNDWREFITMEDIFINGSYGSFMPAPVYKSILIIHFPWCKIPNLLMKKDFKPSYFINQNSEVRMQFRNYLHITENGVLHLSYKEKDSNIQTLIRNLKSSNLANSIPASGSGFNFAILGNSGLVQLNEKLKLGFFERLAKIPNAFKNSYSQVWTHSGFVKTEVEKRWGLESEIVYPPTTIKSLEGPRIARNPYEIVSVGRFVHPLSRGHSKRQEILIKSFKKLSRNTDIPWKLTLIGGVNQSPKNLRYLRKLEKMALELNIEFQVNKDRKTVLNNLQKSTFYWHAAGWKARDNMKKEHFGISVIEAMQFGCIPLVYNSGGPAEILRNFPNLLVDKIMDFASKTKELTKSDLGKLQKEMISISMIYGTSIFEEKVQKNMDLLMRIKDANVE